MSSPLRVPGVLGALAAVGLALAVAGCGHKVGDTCNTNVDCSPLGDRFCDVTSPGGYCTIEGCDVRMNEAGDLIDSCANVASESECVRFFNQQLDKACEPANAAACCASDEVCLCDNADPNNVGTCRASMLTGPNVQTTCTPANGTPITGLKGHCAKQSSERRWCMLKCSGESDCRDSGKGGYHCIQAGTNGAEPVPRGLQSLPGDAGLVGNGDYSQKFCQYKP